MVIATTAARIVHRHMLYRRVTADACWRDGMALQRQQSCAGPEASSSFAELCLRSYGRMNIKSDSLLLELVVVPRDILQPRSALLWHWDWALLWVRRHGMGGRRRTNSEDEVGGR
ncbi:hypothetical protein Tdes44962_MAKER07187 [Teratosphaeria destructans]|uniref:Uncharacterized protein n=1 Tax=Teratosphaeria destructans TaxID=418781 RepID=A0A9W7SZT5_9PEZI|nr:hypothetical protein Tdes44962_MAKER07187 [Teratosphaeria destructans]